MEFEEADEIFKRYRAGTCSPEEKGMVESWYLEMADDSFVPFDEAMYSKMKDQSWQDLEALQVQKPVRLWLLWRKLAIAAAILLVGFATFYIYHNNTPENGHIVVVTQNDHASGGNKAILRLNDGRDIELSTKQSGIIAGPAGISYPDGELLPESIVPGMLTMSVPPGGTYQLRLPDGTKVWLNAASSLTFNSNTTEQRIVELSGEAYFEVFKDSSRPFLVKTVRQQIEVLGTHFNVNAYPEESITRTTLLEGSIRLSTTQHPARLISLQPNQEALLSAVGTFQVRSVDPARAIAWQKGQFTYNRTPMEEVMHELARWYNIKVQYENESLKGELLSGSVNRYENLSGILNALKFTSGLDFLISGNTVIVREK